MTKPELVKLMLEMLQGALDAHRIDEGTNAEPVQASVDLPLIGESAAVTSMGLVSFIADVESTLQEKYGLELTLVSEQALSRKKSPFRTIEALVEYVLELTGNTTGIEASAA
ncbi:MAG: hypothetical protein ACT4OZ_15530 [Gemmatimonadota bacterium]